MSTIINWADFKALWKATKNLLLGPSLLTLLGLNTDFLMKIFFLHPPVSLLKEIPWKYLTIAQAHQLVTASPRTRNLSLTMLNIPANKQKRQKVAFFWEHGCFRNCITCNLDHCCANWPCGGERCFESALQRLSAKRDKMSSFTCLSPLGSFLIIFRSIEVNCTLLM